MNEAPAPAPPEKPASFTPARVLTGLGLLAFLVIFLFDDGRDLYPYMVDGFMSGEVPQGEDAVIVSILLMLTLLATATPFLIQWLALSRLMTRLLRIVTLITAACFWWFLLRYGATAAEILIPLALSPTLTFIGLCLIRHPAPAAPVPR